MTSFITDNQMRRISEIFRLARVEYAHKAAPIAEKILQGYVPIETGVLQKHIKAVILNDHAIVGVPDATLIYNEPERTQKIDATYLARILNIPAVRKDGNRNPKRTKSNRYPGTAKRQPTANWYEKAVARIRAELTPIGKEILQRATLEAMNVLKNG